MGGENGGIRLFLSPPLLPPPSFAFTLIKPTFLPSAFALSLPPSPSPHLTSPYLVVLDLYYFSSHNTPLPTPPLHTPSLSPPLRATPEKKRKTNQNIQCVRSKRRGGFFSFYFVVGRERGDGGGGGKRWGIFVCAGVKDNTLLLVVVTFFPPTPPPPPPPPPTILNFLPPPPPPLRSPESSHLSTAAHSLVFSPSFLPPRCQKKFQKKRPFSLPPSPLPPPPLRHLKKAPSHHNPPSAQCLRVPSSIPLPPLSTQKTHFSLPSLSSFTSFFFLSPFPPPPPTHTLLLSPATLPSPPQQKNSLYNY